MSPTSRSLKALRNDGWTVDIVERWIPGARIRKDLFNMADLLAIKSGRKPLLVQVTSSRVAERVRKIQASEIHGLVTEIFDIEVHGWTKRANGRYKCRIVSIT